MEPRISIITLAVSNLARSHDFYYGGPGFPTSGTPQDRIIFFKTSGTCLALHPFEKLAEDVEIMVAQRTGGFAGITL